MKTYRPILFVFFLLSLLIAVPGASAHRPEEGLEDSATAIPDPSTSYAYYREFFAEGEFLHLYTVQGTEGQEFHAGINIPQLAGLETYGVTLGVFGPGFPDVTAIDLQGFPGGKVNRPSMPALPSVLQLAEVPELAGLGGVIVSSLVTEDFYEPFTQTNYWGRQSLNITFPETGTYYLAVWQPDEAPGKYVLDTGRDEVFGLGDLFRFPVWWWNTRAYFDQLPNLWIPVLIAVLGLVGWVVYRRRARAALSLSSK